MSSELVSHATTVYQSRRYTDTVDIIDSVLHTTKGTEHVDLLLLQAKCFVEVLQYDSALRILSSLLADFEVSGETRQTVCLLLMRCCYAVRQWKRCLEYAKEIISSGTPAVVEGHCTAGRVALIALGNTQQAFDHYLSALQIDPFCSAALKGILDSWLTTPSEQERIIAGLEFPVEAEALRDTFFAKVASPQLQRSWTRVAEYLQVYRAAMKAYHMHDLVKANAATATTLRLCPTHEASVCLRLAVLVDQRATSELFDFAHSVSERWKNSALAAYAIGCFYFAVANFDKAGRFFCRCTEIEPLFAPGWIAYGHCYAKLEEGEQALAAYRRAQALFPGLQQCKLYLGMQYCRAHAYSLAATFLKEADIMQDRVPLVLNELGVLAIRAGNLSQALTCFAGAREAQQNSENPSEYEDCIIFNLATVLRKMKEYDRAIELYSLYARLRPYAVCAHSALGFTHHLVGNIRNAIEHYHAALSIKPDGFTRDLLERALSEEYKEDVGGERWSESGGTGPSPHLSISAVSRMGRSESLSTADPSPRPDINRILTF